MKREITCHKLIAKVAAEAANELYEKLMGDNLMYSSWKKKNPGKSNKALRAIFVRRNTGKCIPFARATLARLLDSPTLSQSAKDDIMEALTLDSTLQKGRVIDQRILFAEAVK